MNSRAHHPEEIKLPLPSCDGKPCTAQAPEWEQRQRVRAEELVTIHDTNKLLNDCDELIPKWFNVVKGVVDSEDLPLNVYRKTLLQNKILRVIKKNHVTKYLEMLAETAELNDDRKKFDERFVKCMKFGIRENSVDDVETAELLRFNTFKPGDEQIDFEGFVDRMKEGQNDIYCITGESIAAVSSIGCSGNIRTRRVMRYSAWLTLWMNMTYTSPRSLMERSRNRQRRRDRSLATS